MIRVFSLALLVSSFSMQACKPKQDEPSAELTEPQPDFDFQAEARRRYFVALREYQSADATPRQKSLHSQTLSTLGRADIIAKDGLLRDPRQSCGDELRPTRPISDWLPQLARDHTLVIINEDHRRPRDRAYVQDVLETLQPLGFTHYAAETFGPEIGASTDPFASYQDGYYVEDPIFGRLLSYAKTSGFTLVPYEITLAQFAPEGSDVETRIATREAAQVENLLSAVLTENPTTKMIIHVGHSHVAERPIPNRSGDGETEWMAARLKKRTGIDPLTISQTACGTESAVSVFLTDEENADKNELSLFTDIVIGHPAQTFLDGRSDWRRAHGDIDVDIPAEWLNQNAPLIIEARKTGQSKDAVPTDLVAILPGETDVSLLLPPGDYQIEAYTEAGNIGETALSVKP